MTLMPVLVEQISEICLKCYQNLNKTGKPNDTEWTSLSCLVLEENNQKKVISLSTGTKCLPGNQKKKSNTLVDSHAEALCKRAFKRYLIHRIKSNNFLEDYRLHLFISQLPCGVVERYQGERKREPNTWLQRKPGRGELCFEASCVDKIAKWNLLGLQGRRLYGFIKKSIKLDSIIIGNCSFESEFDETLLASCLKVNKQGHFDSHIPNIYFCQSFKYDPFIRRPGLKACPTAIVYWQESRPQVEIVVNGLKQGTTKKNAATHSLKISPQSLLKNIQDMIDSSNNYDSQLSDEYLKTWNELKNSHERFKGWKREVQVEQEANTVEMALNSKSNQQQTDLQAAKKRKTADDN